MIKIFVDGNSGTTGLRIIDRLNDRKDIELISLPEELRKNVEERKNIIRQSDISFLCLPDDASREIVDACEDIDTVIIDTSTAHRTDDRFVYGFPEIVGSENIKKSNRISNPGCHASGFISLVAPLVKEGIISKESYLNCFSITGYSGGGKKMITEYEDTKRSNLLGSPRQYGVTQNHKHLKEMQKYCDLTNAPIFSPIVADFYSGMELTVPIFKNQIKGNLQDIISCYKSYYVGPVVKYKDSADESGYLASNVLSGFDNMEISVEGNEDRIILTSRYDNLGKGASGAAIQNMNIVLGFKETEGLLIKE